MQHTSAAPGSTTRERALAAARRRLRLLEIETHRVKAELARLEAESEDDIADGLSDELEQHLSRPAVVSSTGSHGAGASVAQWAPQSVRAGVAAGRAASESATRPRVQIAVEPRRPGGSRDQPPAPRKYRRATPAWLMSLGLHAVALLLLLPWTFAVLSNDNIALLVSAYDPRETALEEIREVTLEPTDVEEIELQEVALAAASLDLADSFVDEFSPVPNPATDSAAERLGQLDALPSDIGTLMAGAGGNEGRRRGDRSRGRRGGTANFFGTEAIGDRIVFLVDNSNSMKQGRMETTLLELQRSVANLTEAQSFYVIFYSDQVYAMFHPDGTAHPVAANRANKQRLFQWLNTVELCNGGKLLDAVDIAASLRPDIVFILSDGDISSVRTMERLTRQNDWEFVIHTLGMGVKKPEHAANLTAIAQSNRGTFQMVRPTPAAIQMARSRPIPSNKSGESWVNRSDARLP